MNIAATNKDIALQLLCTLYEPGVAQTTLERIWSRLPDQPIPGAAPRNHCMIISYADSVSTEGEAPLQTLRRFLNVHVGETFGRVHLLPFFPSSSDDGFAVIDYRMVDHHVGAWQDVEDLADNYDLMFDLVINHCSRESLWFADFVNGREPGRHYFITLPEESDVSQVVRPRSSPLISAVHTYGGIRHVWNTFSEDQIDLDFSNPQVLLEFVDILMLYIERGAKLIRLDAVAFLWKRLGTNCMSLPETHALVKLLRVIVDEVCPHARLITETNVPHEENVSYFGEGDEAHIVYQFSLAPLLLYSFVFGDGTYLTNWALRLSPPPSGTKFLNFIASHDGIGLRPLEGLMPQDAITRLVDKMHERGGFVMLRDAGGNEQRPYEINISLMSAFGGEPGLNAYVAAHAVLVSFRGMPALYIHSLLGTLNDIKLVEQTGRTRSINRSRWQWHELHEELKDPDSMHTRVFQALLDLIERRNQQAALQPHAAQEVIPTPPSVFAMRRSNTQQVLLIVSSLVDQAQPVALKELGLEPGTYLDQLSQTTITLADELALAPYQVLWLELPI